MMPDIGTIVAILALALAMIPLPDVFIGWFCMFLPAIRSPASRMNDLHNSLASTRQLLDRNSQEWAEEGDPPIAGWHATWIRIEDYANRLEMLVKGGGWGRYSVAHLRWWMPEMKELNFGFASVTRDLIQFNKDLFGSSQLINTTRGGSQHSNRFALSIDTPRNGSGRRSAVLSAVGSPSSPLSRSSVAAAYTRFTGPIRHNHGHHYPTRTGANEAEMQPLHRADTSGSLGPPLDDLVLTDGEGDGRSLAGPPEELASDTRSVRTAGTCVEGTENDGEYESGDDRR